MLTLIHCVTGPFDVLDGIRSLSMGWIILSHVLIYGLFSEYTAIAGHYLPSRLISHLSMCLPTDPQFTNAWEFFRSDHKGLLGRFSMQAMPGGYLAVDTFFFLAAFLAVYRMMEQVERLQQAEGSPWHFLFKAPYIYIMRYIRLTPTYIYVLLM